MTNEQLKQLRKQAYRSAFRLLGNEQDAEEIANDVMERITVNDLTSYRIKFLVVDAIRKRIGRTDSKNQGQRLAVYYALTRNGDDSGNFEDPRNYLEAYTKGMDLTKLLGGLEPIQRCVAILIVKYGFTNVEVAELFGYTPSWISHLCSDLVKQITEKVQ